LTTRFADAVPPFPPSVDVTALVMLFFCPADVAVTFTLNVHDAFAANVAPDKLTLLDPATAVIVPPPQLPVSPLGVDTTRPAGSVSVKPTPDSAVVAFGFVSVKVKLVLPFTCTALAPKLFAIVAGATTVTFAVAVLPARSASSSR
jgi:hypothetical protein